MSEFLHDIGLNLSDESKAAHFAHIDCEHLAAAPKVRPLRLVHSLGLLEMQLPSSQPKPQLELAADNTRPVIHEEWDPGF